MDGASVRDVDVRAVLELRSHVRDLDPQTADPAQPSAVVARVDRIDSWLQIGQLAAQHFCDVVGVVEDRGLT